MAQSARVPITNVFMGGDYTGVIHVGPNKTAMNVILDTGSSALALSGHKYKPKAGDKTTRLAQTDSYGDGSSWTGAVIQTQISLGDGAGTLHLPDGNASIAYIESSNMFRGADGILGLAYAKLDDAFTMPKDTWAQKYPSVDVRSGKEGELAPYLTQLNASGAAPNIISFLTHRSFVRSGHGDGADPANNGVMIVGGGEEATDLYSGAFKSVKVLDDAWYSTNLKAVIVGTSDPILGRRQGPKGMPSNSIIDSGTNSLNLSPGVLQAVASKLTPDQRQLLSQSVADSQLVSVDALKLDGWPTITFVLEGSTGDVKLDVAPTDYWQVDTEHVGAALAAITQGDAGFTILGLPLMNPYFTVFDGEAAAGRGVVKFAAKAVKP